MATPKDHPSPKGARWPSEVVADNVRDYRALRRLSQDAVADAMSDLGHKWHRATVSEVERRGRAVNVDELLGLAVVLKVYVADLLDARGPDRTRAEAGLYLGDVGYPDGAQYLSGMFAWTLTRSEGRLMLERGKRPRVVLIASEEAKDQLVDKYLADEEGGR